MARYLFKLMAYKDEYEVARLHTDPAFTTRIAAMFEGDYKLEHHLAPPAIARKNDKGELIKQPFGPWMRSAFGVLAKLKGLRGTTFDPFGRSEERRTERALIGEYRAAIDEVLAALTAKRNAKGELVKQPFGPWMRSAFAVLAKLKGLRGGAFDLFARTEERRTERGLIVEYRACIDELLAGLSRDNLALAVDIARIPEEIRGYGHVKDRHLAAARSKWAALMADWRAGGRRKAA